VAIEEGRLLELGEATRDGKGYCLITGVLELFSKRKRNEGMEGLENITGDKSEGTGVGPEACHGTEWGEATGGVGHRDRVPNRQSRGY